MIVLYLTVSNFSDAHDLFPDFFLNFPEKVPTRNSLLNIVQEEFKIPKYLNFRERIVTRSLKCPVYDGNLKTSNLDQFVQKGDQIFSRIVQNTRAGLTIDLVPSRCSTRHGCAQDAERMRGVHLRVVTDARCNVCARPKVWC